MEVVELVNRSAQDQTFMYNSREYKVPAKKSVHLEKNCAEHGMSRCIYRLDPITGSYHFKLGIRTVDAEGNPVDVTDCSPIDYVPEKNEELIDREAMGEKEKVKVISFSNADAPREVKEAQKEVEWG